MSKILIILISIFIGISINSVYSQEIKSNVVVNTEKLPFEALTYVSSMASDIQNYINSQKFTDAAWEGEQIPVDITIVLSGGAKNVFSARMIVVSKRRLDGIKGSEPQSVALKIKEEAWTFEYNMGANFTYNTLRYDNVVSMIDFYMLMVIGFDMDTYGELDGSNAFDKAKSIFSLAASQNIDGFKTYAQPGEFTKYNLISELNDMRYQDFRKIIFSYYVDGLDKMYSDRESALKNLESIVARMANYKQNKLVGPSVFMQLFFDTKGQELAFIFNGYPTKEVFKNLMFLDPSNTMLYQDASYGKLNK